MWQDRFLEKRDQAPLGTSSYCPLRPTIMADTEETKKEQTKPKEELKKKKKEEDEEEVNYEEEEEDDDIDEDAYVSAFRMPL